MIMSCIYGALSKTYVRGIGLIASKSSNVSTYYFFNGHGDVVQFGNTVYDYDAFGNERNPSDSDTNSFRYCGEYWDSETETLYLRARYYDARIGRFATEDPIRDGLNWYTYCYGNPIFYHDPFGQAPKAEGTSKGSDGKARNFYNKHKRDVRLSYEMYLFYLVTRAELIDNTLWGALGAEKDKSGVYHIRQDYWQSNELIGYNGFYDTVAMTFTDIRSVRFDFYWQNGKQDITLWAWKGDYCNLGAGAVNRV